MTLLAQAGAGTAFFLQLVLIIAIFYFLLIMPHRREQKRHREMVAALRQGDRVVTSGGLIGEIVHVADDQLTLKTGDVRVLVERGRVARKLEDTAGRPTSA